MKRLVLGTLAALTSAWIVTTIGVSGQGRVDSPGVMTPEGGVPAPGSYKVPKTPWGEPNLQGTYNANDLQGIPMQRPQAAGTRYRLNDEEFKQRVAQRDQNVANDNSFDFTLERGEEFEARFGTVGGAVSPPPHWLERARTVSRVSSYVIDPPDGRIPALTPEAQAAADERQQAQAARRRQLNGVEADSYTDRSNYDRFISTGVLNSITPKIYNSGSRIVQGPGWLAFSNEMIHETRVIPLDNRPHPGKNIRMYMGDSRGHWEGNTLVVETTNLNGKPNYSGVDSTLVERFTRVAPDELRYEATIDDPKTYTRRVRISIPMTSPPGYQMLPYECHEGNSALRQGLGGERAEDRKLAEDAKNGIIRPRRPIQGELGVGGNPIGNTPGAPAAPPASGGGETPPAAR
jgi:hypothetical protein